MERAWATKIRGAEKGSRAGANIQGRVFEEGDRQEGSPYLGTGFGWREDIGALSGEREGVREPTSSGRKWLAPSCPLDPFLLHSAPHRLGKNQKSTEPVGTAGMKCISITVLTILRASILLNADQRRWSFVRECLFQIKGQGKWKLVGKPDGGCQSHTACSPPPGTDPG